MKRLAAFVGLVSVVVLGHGAGVNPATAYIQRSMKAMEESTAEKPAHLRVLFYGQSITAQPWTKTLSKELEERYPTVKFEFKNLAIGGAESPRLVQTAEHDLYPWYPDLLFFHVYGATDKYEDIVRRTRERTAAEIVLWTSHTNAKDDPAKLLESPDQRTLDILEIADRYKCHKIDLRKKWCSNLVEKELDTKHYLSDFVHLNNEGCELYAKYVGEEILRVAELGDNPESSGTIKEFAIGAPCVSRGADGKVEFKFSGNRVVAIADGSGSDGAEYQVLLDGKPVAEYKEMWAITRPSTLMMWQPAIWGVSFESLPVAEDWSLTVLEGSATNASHVVFKVSGSVTGDDGEGNDKERFVSKSGRVVIEPKIAWGLQSQAHYKKKPLEVGSKITWKSYLMATERYKPQEGGKRSVLIQGCSNGEHTMTLVPLKPGSKCGISGFVVHTPPK